MATLPKAQRDLLVPPMLQSLLICLYTRMQDTSMPQEVKPEGTISGKHLKTYIDSHYTEKLSLDQLAGVFYCTKGYLNTVFKT